MSQGIRLKFNGSTFSVGTSIGGASPTPSITAISKTDPIIVTSAVHGLTQADVVRLSAILGMTELNGRIFVVDDTTTNDFALAGEDGTMNSTYTSGGKIDEFVFAEFCELTGANQQGAAAPDINVSTICSTAEEFERGLRGAGTLQMDYNAAPLSAVQTALRDLDESGAFAPFKIVFPNSGGTVIMLGYVQQQSLSGVVGDVWKGSTTIKLSGPIFVN